MNAARSSVRLAALIVVLGGAAACDWFDDPTVELVRVELTGDAGSTVDVVTSVTFVTAANEFDVTTVELLNFDQRIITLPFDTIIDISGDNRFFIQATEPDSLSNNFRMRIFLDSDLEYDQGGLLEEGPYLFVFQFNQPIFGQVEVI